MNGEQTKAQCHSRIWQTTRKNWEEFPSRYLTYSEEIGSKHEAKVVLSISWYFLSANLSYPLKWLIRYSSSSLRALFSLKAHVSPSYKKPPGVETRYKRPFVNLWLTATAVEMLVTRRTVHLLFLLMFQVNWTVHIQVEHVLWSKSIGPGVELLLPATCVHPDLYTIHMYTHAH